MQKIYALFFVLFFQSYLFGQNYTSYFTGSSLNVTTLPQGGICMMGGATENDEAMRWFLQRSNGGDILVLRATGSNGYNTYLYSTLGVAVNSVETIVCNNAAASNETYIKQKIQQAEAIWFAGGDQWDYISYWRHTAIDSLINDAIINRNIVIGGTSAGMAILGKFYFSAQNGTVSSAAALADPYTANATVDSAAFIKNYWLRNVITDTHYDNPDRRGRQTAFLGRIKKDWGLNVKGIACDEYTAVCIDPTGMAKVYGSYPTYDDNAYFIQSNCEVVNNTPEICVPGSPLTWNQSNQALKVYNVKGTATGSNTFNLNDWKTGTGGNWQNWFANNGAWQSAASVTPTCINLPVKILSFTARKNRSEVQLDWQTTNEINNNYFNVQRSSDGIHFITIQKVMAATTNSVIYHYSAIDTKPLTGTALYRLQQTDKDGRFEYSEMVTIDFVKATAFSIYPNPCIAKRLYVDDKGSRLQNLVITDAAGRKIFAQNINSATTLHCIEIASLKAGVYSVQLYSKGNEDVEEIKLIVD